MLVLDSKVGILFLIHTNQLLMIFLKIVNILHLSFLISMENTEFGTFQKWPNVPSSCQLLMLRRVSSHIKSTEN